MPDCGTISPGLYSCAILLLRNTNLFTIWGTVLNRAAFRPGSRRMNISALSGCATLKALGRGNSHHRRPSQRLCGENSNRAGIYVPSPRSLAQHDDEMARAPE